MKVAQKHRVSYASGPLKVADEGGLMQVARHESSHESSHVSYRDVLQCYTDELFRFLDKLFRFIESTDRRLVYQDRRIV